MWRQERSLQGRESESRQEDIWTHSSSIPTLKFDSGGSEAADQEGRKQVCMCVWLKESVCVCSRIEKSGSGGCEF